MIAIVDKILVKRILLAIGICVIDSNENILYEYIWSYDRKVNIWYAGSIAESIPKLLKKFLFFP